jgi:hypothetical protein
VTQSDFSFTPRVVTAHTGDRLTISNVSAVSPHTFTIASKGIDVVNSPGQSQSITITMKPGSYPFVCTFHQALGMTGTLVVSAPGTSPAPALLAAAGAATTSGPRSGGTARGSGASPGPSVSPSPSGQALSPMTGGAETPAAAQSHRARFPLGVLVIVAGSLALGVGGASLVLNLQKRGRLRAPR